MKIAIDVNAAVRIWDILNEVALNHPKGSFRRSVIRYRNVERTNDVQTVTIEINAGSQRKE